MQKRYRSWMADWYDKNGKRKRKAFPTRSQAVEFQKLQQAATKNKHRRTRRSPKSSPATPKKSRGLRAAA
jgi:hypothetical protein